MTTKMTDHIRTSAIWSVVKWVLSPFQQQVSQFESFVYILYRFLHIGQLPPNICVDAIALAYVKPRLYKMNIHKIYIERISFGPTMACSAGHVSPILKFVQNTIGYHRPATGVNIITKSGHRLLRYLNWRLIECYRNQLKHIFLATY